MSCIVAVKGSHNCSVVISDFRITQQCGKQADSVLKYIETGNLVVFMAGSVYCLEFIKRDLDKLSGVKHEDISSKYSTVPLLIQKVLNNYVPGAGGERNSFIIVHLDHSTLTHKLIKLDFSFSNDQWNILDFINDNDFEWEVIGTGDIITDEIIFQKRIPNSLYKAFNSFAEKYDVFEAASGILQEVHTRLEIAQKAKREEINDPGYNIYSDLGISSILNFALIQGDAFALQYTENEVGEITNKGMVKIAEYSIEDNAEGGVTLKDKLSNEEISANKPLIKNEPKISAQNKFDPLKKEH